MANIEIRKVEGHNWRDVAKLRVHPEQQQFVAEPTHYLCLCHYGGEWRPLAVYHADEVVGFLMWAVDPADGSCWLGGILIDAEVQGQGFGTAATRATIEHLQREFGYRNFALSYQAANTRASGIYARLGFVETGEAEDSGELVARLELKD